jgi:hypothetical protein
MLSARSPGTGKCTVDLSTFLLVLRAKLTIRFDKRRWDWRDDLDYEVHDNYYWRESFPD